MGASNVKYDHDDEETYLQLTYLTKNEIEKCYKKFLKLLSQEQRDQLYRAESINDVQFRVPIDLVTGQLVELKVNPFAQQLCSVFAQNQKFMMFEDFIDMMSVLSERAPAQVKAEWAFKMFDYDNDGRLNKNDIMRVVKQLTNFKDENEDDIPDNSEQNQLIENVVKAVMDETDINKSGYINISEFKQIVSKSHDFKDNFRIKV